MIKLYRALSYLVSPLLPFWLQRRALKGKEDSHRMQERLGKASVPRPAGKLIWIHAASVGESNAALPLIENLLAASPHVSILLTTVTVTSAALMASRLPPRAMHQFAPVDTPQAVHAFLDYWYPTMGLFIDSELWPNMFTISHQRGTVLGIVNARMSERSYKRWKLIPSFIRSMLRCVTFCFAQTHLDAKRLGRLGMKTIQGIGNLKYDAAPLPCDETELATLEHTLAGRPVFLAASTHDGEESILMDTHIALSTSLPQLLTIILPRHSMRGAAIAEMARTRNLSTAVRSKGEMMEPATQIYLADTMGELGLFYPLADCAFIGGSLVPHGGQNPIEAAQPRLRYHHRPVY